MRIKAAGLFETVKLIVLVWYDPLEGVGFGVLLLGLCSTLIAPFARFQQGSFLFPLAQYRIPFSQ